MNRCTIYIHGYTPVSKYAGEYLRARGVSTVTSPGPEVTHLLLGVPNRLPEKEVASILSALPPDVTVVGGRLDIPGIDLLEDDAYLRENAKLTAHCALALGMELLPITLEDCPVLVIGWGRIGKALSPLLKALGAEVTVASRSAGHRAEAKSLGYRAEDSGSPGDLGRFRLVYNTAPAPVISREQARAFRQDCVILDLASKPGIGGERPKAALGLPGKMVPESSGRLIGSTLLRILESKEETQ